MLLIVRIICLSSYSLQMLIDLKMQKKILKKKSAHGREHKWSETKIISHFWKL